MKTVLSIILLIFSFAWCDAQGVVNRTHLSPVRWTDLIQRSSVVPRDAATQKFLLKLDQPVWSYCAAPFLAKDEVVLRYFVGSPRQRPGLMVGLDVKLAGGHKVLLVNLIGSERILALDTATKFYNHGLSQLSNGLGFSWEPADLDGDGAIDLIGEYSAGTASFTTIYAFYFDGKTFRQVLLADDIAIGNIWYSRNRNGCLVIHACPRSGEPCLSLAWQNKPTSQPLRFAN